MSQTLAQFVFDKTAPMDEVEGTLHLARIAVESLFGVDRAGLESRSVFNEADRTVEIDVASEIGRTWAIIFSGYARREFGAKSMHMCRLQMPQEELETSR